MLIKFTVGDHIQWATEEGTIQSGLVLRDCGDEYAVKRSSDGEVIMVPDNWAFPVNPCGL